MIRRPPRSTLFPYRRSSDLNAQMIHALARIKSYLDYGAFQPIQIAGIIALEGDQKCVADRKSTRLNSSHSQISYAVFCLKKKKHTRYTCNCPAAAHACNM